MAVPDYQSLMLPLLRKLGSETAPKAVRSFIEPVADEFQLTDEERAERLPSGGENLLLNRLAWARTYLGKAGLLTSPRHGLIEISERGRKVLESRPEKINVQFLRQFPEFKEWMAGPQRAPEQATGNDTPVRDRNASSSQTNKERLGDQTPRERIDNAKQELESALQEDLLQRVQKMSPSDFEDLILRLLLAMGYGQGIEEMASALGGAGDGGMDG